jgi:hypothetical protein
VEPVTSSTDDDEPTLGAFSLMTTYRLRAMAPASRFGHLRR